jgi:hypothetical protein
MLPGALGGSRNRTREFFLLLVRLGSQRGLSNTFWGPTLEQENIGGIVRASRTVNAGR